VHEEELRAGTYFEIGQSGTSRLTNRDVNLFERKALYKKKEKVQLFWKNDVLSSLHRQPWRNKKFSKNKMFFFEKKNQKTFLLRFARC